MTNHIVAVIRKGPDDIKYICTSVCYQPIKIGTMILTDNDGKFYVTTCKRVSELFYHFSNGELYAKNSLSSPNRTDSSIIVIASEFSKELPTQFAAKLKNLNVGTKILIETADDEITLKTRKDGTYIIHRYAQEAQLHDALSDVKDMLECRHIDKKDIIDYIEEVLYNHEIKYF